jgi:hypothetical protein
MLLLTEDYRVLCVDRGLGGHTTVYVGSMLDMGGVGTAAVTLHYYGRL